MYVKHMSVKTTHAEGVATVPLQGRVLPEHRLAFNAAAKASGLSVNLYMDTLITHLQNTGGLPILAKPKPQEEELPIAQAS